VFRLIEGEAEGRFAIMALVIIALAVLWWMTMRFL